MKILLTAINAKYIHSNLAVYSLRAYAKKYGNIENIELLETTINNRVEDIIDEIYEAAPDVCAISCYIWNIEYVYKIIPQIKKLMPDMKIWLGGPEVSYHADELMQMYPQIDAIMCGEGEKCFLKLCEEYQNGDDKRRIVSENEALDMNTIPFPYENIEDLSNRIVYYESSRGCPFSCSYCLSSVEKQLRFRDLSLVKEELAFFIKKKVPLVKFVDRTFNCKQDHALEIWKFILENDNGITRFHFEVAADLMSDEQIELIGRMRPGLIQLEVGVQSTNLSTIKEIKRVMSYEKVCDVVEKVSRNGNIHMHLDLIAGLPYEDYNSFKKSFNDVYSLRPNQLQLGFLKLLTGSYMHEKHKEYGMYYKDFPPYEILYTKWLSYDDVLKLKQVEEVVEIYYNSGQFVYTIKYLEKYFEEAFDMYYELGMYYKEHYPRNIKHSRIDRYNILKRFFETIESDVRRVELFCQVMNFDIYLRENMHTRPPFAIELEPYKDEIRRIRNELGLRRTEHVEPINNDAFEALKELDGLEELEYIYDIEYLENTYFIFDYSNRDELTGNGRIKCLKNT